MKILKKFQRTVLTVLMTNLLLIAVQGNVSANPTTPDIIHPDDARAQTGNTYGARSAAWWKYVFEIPLDNNPIFDATGANCNHGQTGSVSGNAGWMAKND